MEYVYIVLCADDTLYTGYTNCLTARLAAHNSGKGAKYTRGRTPVQLVWSEIFCSRSEALRHEAAIKRLTRAQKNALIAEQNRENVEMLTIFDAHGRACGKRPREVVHRQGLLHEVVHLWVLAQQNGVSGVWMQQRAYNRIRSLGHYDLPVTGHVDASKSVLDAVLREAREEYGLTLSETMLHKLAAPLHQQYAWEDGVHFDDELAHIYLYRAGAGVSFVPDDSAGEMRWVSLEALDQRMEAQNDLVQRNGANVPCERLRCYHADEWRAVRTWMQAHNWI